MKIYNPNGEICLDVEVDDTSCRYRAIMGEHNLTLRLSLAQHCEIPIGAYCDFQGTRYTLMRPEDLKKNNGRNYDYTVTFQSEEYKARIWKFRNTVDGRLKFPLTATPQEHLKMIVENLNDREAGWTPGSCIEGTEVLINYDHDFCQDALAKIAAELKTEYYFEGKTVCLGKIEINKEEPLRLSYGKGNGFVTGVGRSNATDNPPAEILYVQGGSTNIDRSKYPPADDPARAASSGCLLLPRNASIRFDGSKFEDEEGFNTDAARTYTSDNLGLSIHRIDRTPGLLTEDSLDLSHIYPNRVGEVSEVVSISKADGTLYDIVDKDIPETLNFEECIIGDNKLTVKFQSGMLAGKEFEAVYVHQAVNGKSARRFELVPQEFDGITMPSDPFIPKKGDKYIVLNCSLPAAYINAYAYPEDPKAGAEWELFRAAVRHLYEAEEQHFTFSGTLDGIWAKKDWVNIGGKIKLGGFVLFSDEAFAPEGEKVRIVGIKDYVNNPHAPEIELSNSTVSSSVATTLRTLEAEEVTVQENYAAAVRFAKRRWRDAKETAAMLEKALLTNFSESISPITVNTMQMLVGDEALQFRFVDSIPPADATEHPAEEPFDVEWNKAEKIFKAPKSFIQHMTLGISGIKPGRAPEEYKYWEMESYESPPLLDPAQKYYLYARVPKLLRPNLYKGTFRLEVEAKPLSEVRFYNLLVGVLNSEREGDRSFVPLYGFTEILPGRITTGQLVSSDGKSYFDMVNSALRLGDKLQYNVNGDGKLHLRGVLVQSPDGIAAPLSCFRGDYDNDAVYYEGDEVTYAAADNLPKCAYRCISPQVGPGTPPTDALRWHLTAAGVAGEPGTSIRVRGTFIKHYVSRAAYRNDNLTTFADHYALIDHDEVLNADCVVAHYTIPTLEVGQPMPLENTTYVPAENGDAWVRKSDGHLFIASGSQGWQDAGQFRGEDGAPGNYTKHLFAVNGSTSVPPAINSNSLTPAGWSAAMPSVGMGQYLWMSQAVISGTSKALVSQWSRPVRINAQDGKDGASPAMVFRGNYKPDETYYGTPHRLDCVKLNDAYFIARIDAGEFSGITPGNTNKWNPFGASFDSVATNLLLAEYAHIDNLGVGSLKTANEGKRIDINKEGSNAMVVHGAVEQDFIEISGDVLNPSALFADAEVQALGSFSRSVSWHKDDPQGRITTEEQLKNFKCNHPSTLHGRISLTLAFVNDGTQVNDIEGQYEILVDDKTLANSVIKGVETRTVTADISMPLTAGNHVIKVRRTTYINTGIVGGNAELKFKIDVVADLKASANIRKSNYFANGNAIGCSPTQFSQTTIHSGQLTHRIEAGNAGLSLKNGKLCLKLGGEWYALSKNASNQLVLTPINNP